MYYTYLLRCTDGSLYAGIAADLKRRMKQHFAKDPRCAKYTKSHPPLSLCAAWESEDRAEASRLEYHLKRLAKEKKEFLASGGELDMCAGPEFCGGYRSLSGEELESATEFLHKNRNGKG